MGTKSSHALPYQQAKFLISAAKLAQLPKDHGIEVAFAGRSNAGKSSAINVITGIKGLARTSKTPGRTQLINLFEFDKNRRLVDLPGYGYAKVPAEIKQRWQHTLELYLQSRECLKGLMLIMDIRHPLKEFDQHMIDWAFQSKLNVHILLTKADKLSRSAGQATLHNVKKELKEYEGLVTVQTFSALNKEGLIPARKQLDEWYQSRAP